MVLLARLVDWRAVLTIVKPETLSRWHRKGFHRAISTNILDLRARVLVMSGGKGLILDTVLPVHWSDVRSLVLPAVADRRGGP